MNYINICYCINNGKVFKLDVRGTSDLALSTKEYDMVLQLDVLENWPTQTTGK
jgi:hypothetical protein